MKTRLNIDYSVLSRMRVNVDALTLQEDDYGEEGKRAQAPFLKYLLLIFFSIVMVEMFAVIILVRVFGKFEIERDGPAKTMVVLGSGGHTAEMLKLVSGMDKKNYHPRCYVSADTDKMSSQRTAALEASFGTSAASSSVVSATGIAKEPDYELLTLPRSREVGQSYFTSVGSTLKSTFYAFAVVYTASPQLILVNGPGTCIPVCFAAAVMRTFGMLPCKIVYVESIARTRKLSLSGLILYKTGIADLLFVQWPELLKKYPRCQHAGRLY
eukprot:gene26351-17448_t